MNSASTMKSDINLVYPAAGVRFTIEITAAPDGESSEAKENAKLNISVKEASGEKSLAFTEECSPVMGDFIGGFVRWLSTLGITATHSSGAITGSFRADYNVFKLIKASGAICDMIDHRFSLYQDSILA